MATKAQKDDKKKAQEAPRPEQEQNTKAQAPENASQPSQRPGTYDARRQSAPRQDAYSFYADSVRKKQAAQQQGSVNGFQALNAPIGKEAIHKATAILQKYKEGKANLERRIVENEQWYKLRHWECLRTSKPEQVEPTSAWLFNCIENKHADCMDNFPEPNVLPREEGDKAEAEMLSSIIPVILDQCDFESVYDDVCRYKLKSGTGVYGVFWDASRLNGLGDISIQKIDLINLFWESGITDIQKSQHVFHVDLVDNEQLYGQYPQLQGKLSTSTIDVAKYVYDDSVDTTEKSVVVDWYYKKMNSQGKKVLHYVKYVNDEVLFATENTPEFQDRGFYDHGEFPFVFDPLFRVEGTPTGFGYVDVGKNAQEFIDRGNMAIMKSMLVNARPRYFIKSDGSVNEKEYADMTNDFVHVDGALGQDSIIPVSNTPFSNTWVDVLQYKIDEMKETTGNRDVSSGGTSGATAASAIAAMQEAGSKLSRDSNKSTYRAFRKIVLLCIELIRQFYDLPRCFRIVGANGMQKFVSYSNAGIAPQQQGIEFGIDMGIRVPLFDVEVSAEKQSPYSKLSQNELALQFYQAGFFSPTMADQALMCLGMMNFDGRDELMGKIQQAGGMLQQMMMLAQMVDQMRGGTEISDAIAQQYGMAAPNGGNASSAKNSGEESSVTQNARKRVAESTAPR